MTYEQAARWLSAIGGTHAIVPDAWGGEAVVVSVQSATKGEVTRRMSLGASLAGHGSEEPFRRAFVLACEELQVALG